MVKFKCEGQSVYYFVSLHETAAGCINQFTPGKKLSERPLHDMQDELIKPRVRVQYELLCWESL